MKSTVTTISYSDHHNLTKVQNLRKVSKNNIPQYLNQEIAKSESEFICLIDDKNNPAKLKDSCLDLMQMAMDRNTEAGMVYADYEIVTNGKVEEIHLLKHHVGKVRDNQDYGEVFLFRKSYLGQIGGFDEELKHHFLYDIRLKLSEVSEITHIANRYNGSLYQVTSSKERTNVFDYLLSDENVQIEAEEVLTNHLKRIDAYLSPNHKYEKRPVILNKPLSLS